MKKLQAGAKAIICLMNKILYGFPFYMYNPSTCIQYQIELQTTLNGFLKELNLRRRWKQVL